MLEFDAKTTAFLERCYEGGDFVRRRRATYDALRPAPGDRIADVGCGNGMLTADFARAVGDEGAVFGIDPSPTMRDRAVARTSDLPNVTIAEGRADALPLETASCHKAACVQVFEYVPDMAAGIRELARVLAPGGLMAVGDLHFDCLAWATDDQPRMDAMRAAWDGHLVHRDAPAQLPGLMNEAGLSVEQVLSVPFTDHQLRPDGLAAMMIVLMRDYVVQNGMLPEAEAEAWADEQYARARDGRFFFSLSHFVVVARKPDAA